MANCPAPARVGQSIAPSERTGLAGSDLDVTFSVRDDGQVDALIGPELPVFQEALNDSVSSLPPRGAPGNGPSTYWIDHAENGVLSAQRTGDGRPFTWGNTTVLRLQGDTVVASYDYAEPDEPGDEVPLADFLALLAEWRIQVMECASIAKQPLPETYRRNPAPTG